MDATQIIFLVAIILIIALGLILFLITKNIYVLLLLAVIVLVIFLPSIVAMSNIIKPAIRAMVTGDKSLIKDMADEIFTNWHSLKIVGNKPKGHVMYLVKYPDSPMEYLAYKFFEPVNIVSRGTKILNKVAGNMMDTVFNEDDYIPIYADQGGYYDKARDLIAERIKSKSIYGYPESMINNKRERGYVYPLRSGLFRIAKELKIPVVPVVVEHLSRDMIMSQRTQHIYIGKVISPDTSLDSMMQQTFDFMVKHLQHHYDD